MQNIESRDAWLTGLLPQTAGFAGPQWLDALRLEAADRVNTLHFPTMRDEDWRFSDFSLLRKTAFAVAEDAASGLTPAGIESFILPEAVASRLVFIDGVYAPQLSSTAALPQGVVAGNLMRELTAHDGAVRAHLARQAHQSDVFVALNTSHVRDGALVLIPKDTVCPVPIHLLFIATGGDAPQAIYPRCLIVAGPGSDCTLIEDYVALGPGSYCTAAVTEITVEENASVRHIRLQREARGAFHLGYGAVTLKRDSIYHANSLTFGARLSRHDLRVVQDGEGARCVLNGLALMAGRQLADTHTVIDHTVPNGKSEQLHKCIVDDGAHAVFNGKIFVRKNAQHTDAAQQSRNLLLSNKGRVDTKPQLEIFADDVKCSHGATVSQLEADEMFYLNSRGLDADAARNLLIYAFAEDIIDRIPVASLKQRLSKELSERILEHA
ncbi:MAG: Fe-S cluster assembly protein SufD [Pseudomonadota bacterium]